VRLSRLLHTTSLSRGLGFVLPNTSLRVLRIFLAACAAVAVLAFVAFAAWRYFDLREDAQASVMRTADVAQEHALKVLDTNESLLQLVLMLSEGAASTLSSASGAEIMSGHLRRLISTRSHIHSILVMDENGRAVAGSRTTSTDFSGRPYFQWHRAGKGGVFASGVMSEEGKRFFNISRGRYDGAGRFLGVVTVAVYSDYFTGFYGRLGSSAPGLAVALVRDDGVLYARWPELNKLPERISDQGIAQMRSGLELGQPLDAISPLDGKGRLVTFRRVAGYPLVVCVGQELNLITSRWLGELARVATLALLPLLLLSYFAYCAMRSARESAAATVRLQREAVARQQAEEALLQAQKLEALGRLTGGVAHDFNNALMVITGNVHLLKRSAVPEQSRSLEAIGRAVEAATKLTRQLLAFTRRQALSPEAVNLQTQLPPLRDLLGPILGRQIELSIDVDADTPSIQVDRAELELALLNLAVNAKDAMQDKGSFRLQVSSGPGRETVVLRAIDTGPGMPADILQKAFDPFFTTKAVGKGTGLGLAQVHTLCARAGGIARIDSTLGAGTTVSLIFPAAKAGAVSNTRAASVSGKSLGYRVLLVEDNPDVASAVSQMLVGLGCHVVHRSEGGAALAYLDSDTALPDLVLTDIVMPSGLGGIELVVEVRRRWPALRVIYMTGYAGQAEMADDSDVPVLAKPFTASQLSDLLQRRAVAL